MNSLLKDKFKLYIFTGVALIFLLIAFSLLEFLFKPVDTNTVPSDIPSLDKSKLEFIVGKIDARDDIDTGGKPDLSNFNFGNEEPFR